MFTLLLVLIQFINYQIDDLPAGDYEIVAMFDNEEYKEKQHSYRTPRLANYRHHSDGEFFIYRI